jgi:NAD(P)-dependent dehydrogenase (short-subunit alcohol dehydrogenase family)
MTDLSGRTVLLTGASKGIGAASARVLGAAGAHLIAHYNSDEQGAREATGDIPEDRKLLLRADLSDPAEARALWQRAAGWRDGIDVLVNNAAILVESPLDGGDDDWDDVWAATYATNVLGPMSLTRAATRHFRERRAGVVITMSSWAAQRGSGNPHLLAYSASKAALKAATQTIARAHAAEGVLAYIVAPGVVRTQMSVDAAAGSGGEDAVTASLAMGEWVPPREIAELIAFLATGRQAHLSGATLDINGASYIR